ncbi:hypothetical protein V5O48_003454 [Marasmius crinis-equi]|uniref:Uncharacterized protein n=1 Tax=Marasmius crinis-equi TaxID=585013 RepID=A0ABR3FSV6_9AGAR
MSHNHNGAQPEAYSNVEPYYSEYNRMLRIPASPPTTKEKMKWAESHLESLSLAKAEAQKSTQIPHQPAPISHNTTESQEDFEMQVDQGSDMPELESLKSNFSPSNVLMAGGDEQLSGVVMGGTMDMDVVADGDDELGCGKKRKADGEVDDAPACKRPSPVISRANSIFPS